VWPWLAAAAVLCAVWIGRPWSRSGTRPDAFQFVLVAPQAASVSLVGDFNDWDPTRAPMRPAHGGVWATVVSLAPGRYRYAFLVNGVEWRADPAAPAARDDEFVRSLSVASGPHDGLMILTALLLVVAQNPAQDPRYDRLDGHARARSRHRRFRARRGLPSEPLIHRALEGAMKNAASERIVAAVRRLAGDLGTHARGAWHEDDDAGARSRRRRVTRRRNAAVLTRMRDVRHAPVTDGARGSCRSRREWRPGRQRPPPRCSCSHHGPRRGLVEFRRAVERDIALGAPPAAATSVRLDATARSASPADLRLSAAGSDGVAAVSARVIRAQANATIDLGASLVR
jgi:hypothetical protein